MGIRWLALVVLGLAVPAWGDGEPASGPPAPSEATAPPPAVVLGFDLLADGRLTADAAEGPLRLGSLFEGSPPGDALEAVRSVLRAVAQARRAAGATGLAGVTMELRVHPTAKWRPVEWLVRVATEGAEKPD